MGSLPLPSTHLLLEKYAMSKTIYHKHHIIPRHVGGSNDPGNIVLLTIDEHAEAHRLLWEQFGRIQDKIAWKCLSGKTDGLESDRVELYRLGGKMSRGRRHTTETKVKIGESNRGNIRPDLAEYNRQTKRGVSRGPQSLEHSQKKADALKRFYQTPEGIAVRERARDRLRKNNPMHGNK